MIEATDIGIGIPWELLVAAVAVLLVVAAVAWLILNRLDAVEASRSLRHRHDAEAARERWRERSLQRWYRSMRDLIVKIDERGGRHFDPLWKVAEAHTKSTLRTLDRVRRADVLRLLVGSGIDQSIGLRDAELGDASLGAALLEGSRLSGVNLQGADLQDALLVHADLAGARLQSAQLSGASLRSANLNGADMEGADLQRAQLNEAHLRSTRLVSANMSEADLRGAVVVLAKLSGADLTGANLSRANLLSVDLSNANLRDADLSKASLTLVDLRHVRGVSKAMLHQAEVVDRVTMPDGSVHDPHRQCECWWCSE